MKSFITYLNEIQKAEITWNACEQNPLKYNDNSNYHYYQTILAKKEIDFIQEYQRDVIFAKCPFLEKTYLLYLNWAYQCFVLEDKGTIKHNHLFYNNCPILTDHLHWQEIEKMIQDYIYTQYESISRGHSLICTDLSLPVSPFAWQGKSSSLMEIGNTLLVCGYVVSVEDRINKHNWYKTLFHFLHLPEPQHIDQTLYKLNNRENPTRFLSDLLTRYEKWLADHS